MIETFDRKIVIALFALFALVLAGSAFCIYRNENSRLSAMHTVLDGDTKRLEDVQEKVSRMPELEASYARLEARLVFLEKPLPTAAYIPTFLAQIEQLARDTNNDIDGIRPREPEKTAGAAGKSDAKINNETGEVMKDDGSSGDKGKQDPKEAKKPVLPYDFVPIDMKIEGTYWKALQFLDKLQSFKKMIAVNTISFSPGKTDQQAAPGSDQRLAVSMTLVAVVPKGDKNDDPQ
jgi:Tfp pilus assembly protein PilO